MLRRQHARSTARSFKAGEHSGHAAFIYNRGVKPSSRALAITGVVVALLLVALWLWRGSDVPGGASQAARNAGELARPGRGPAPLGSGAEPADRRGAIEGVVRDQRGRSLGGATVALSPGATDDREPGTALLLEVRAAGGPARRMRIVRM
jgi:hypothetical protein